MADRAENGSQEPATAAVASRERGLEEGLQPGHRFRCDGCGNLTRFDVETVERVRRFWHVDLAGTGTAEEEDRTDVQVVSVVCRWCGASDRIEVVEALVHDQAGGAADGEPSATA